MPTLDMILFTRYRKYTAMFYWSTSKVSITTAECRANLTYSQKVIVAIAVITSTGSRLIRENVITADYTIFKEE